MKTSLITAAIAIIALALCSCSFSVNPDGSKSGNVDAESAMRAIEIFAAK